MNKKVLTILTVGTIFGLAIVGYAFGGKLLQTEKAIQDPNLRYYQNTDINPDPEKATRILKKPIKEAETEFEKFKELYGIDSEITEYKASNGEVFTILLSPKSKSKKQENIKWIEEQINIQKAIKENLERTPKEREATIAKFKDLFGVNVVYQRVGGNPYTKTNVREFYTDEQGREFEFNVDKNKIIRMDVGSDKWCEVRKKDILDENCHFKEGNLTEEQAKENVLALLTKAIGKEKAKEVVANSEIQRVPQKGNTFVFSYPARTGSIGKESQLLVVVEPVKGEIINYQNYLE